MAFKSSKDPKQPARGSSQPQSDDLLLHRHDFWDPFTAGSWTPRVDICRSERKVVVRAELPGVEASDISVSFQGNCLRIQGIKREPAQSRQLLSYICLERRYGKFDRRINIGCIVNPKEARACLENGILTVELRKLEDRRGNAVEIQIEKK